MVFYAIIIIPPSRKVVMHMDTYQVLTLLMLFGNMLIELIALIEKRRDS